MKKSTLIMLLSLVLAVAIGVGSTMAYLQDTDEDVNVMTLGNVYIDQIEQERIDNEKLPTAEGNLKEFSQYKPLYPAVFDGSSIPWDAASEADQAWKVVENNENVVDKFVTVKNTGASEAYVRTIIAFEGDAEYGPEGAYIHTVSNGSNVEDEITMKHIGVAKIDGRDFTLYEYTYLKPLAPGETTIPSLKQVYMNKNANNDVVAKYGEEYDILVVSQAVQVQGFKDAETALDAAFGDITVDNHPWLGVEPNDAPTKLTMVSSAEELFRLLKEGKTEKIYAVKDLDGQLIYLADGAIELDAKGATVVLDGSDNIVNNNMAYSYLGLVPPIGESAVIENLNVTGTGFVEIGDYDTYRVNNKNQYKGNYVINNVNVKDLVATYHVNMSGMNVAVAFGHYAKNAEMNDCVMTGTTSLVDGYAPYDVAFANATNTVINRGEYDNIFVANQGHLSINDAKVGKIDSTAITANNLGMLTIGDKTTVETINLSTPGNYKPALTVKSGAEVGTITYDGADASTIVIEDGANVGSIIYNGETYTLEQWRKR